MTGLLNPFSVVDAGPAGLGLGGQQGLDEGPRLIRQLPKRHRPSPPKQIAQRESILQPDTGVLR